MTEKQLNVTNNGVFISDVVPNIRYYLEPNELDVLNTVPIQALPPHKLKVLNSSVHEPKFYITIIGYNIHPDFISYTLEVGRMTKDEQYVQIKHTRTRYSKLRELYDSLINDELFKHKLPMFPSKQLFNNLTRETAEMRLPFLTAFVESLTCFIEIRLNKHFNQLVSL